MESKIIVRLEKDWNNSTPVLRQTPHYDGIFENIKFTFDKVPECDYLIVFNRPKEDIHVTCPPGNIWLVAGEPPSHAQDFTLKSYKYFDRIYSQHKKKFSNKNITTFRPVWWHINKSLKDLESLSVNNLNKEDKVSTIVSNLNWMPGHEARLKFMDYLKSENFEFDLFGRGINPIEDKYDALINYKYSIAIENSSYDYYWTEKLADCFLTWTMPIYYGCPNVFSCFPKESIIYIDIKKPKEALQIIYEAIENKYWEKNIDAINEARNLILNKYQTFAFLSDEIKKHNSKEIHKTFFIPKNPSPWELNDPSLYRKIEYRIRKLLNIKPY